MTQINRKLDRLEKAQLPGAKTTTTTTATTTTTTTSSTDFVLFGRALDILEHLSPKYLHFCSSDFFRFGLQFNVSWTSPPNPNVVVLKYEMEVAYVSC